VSTAVPSSSVLKETELARELGSVTHRQEPMRDFSVLDQVMDNGTV